MTQVMLRLLRNFKVRLAMYLWWSKTMWLRQNSPVPRFSLGRERDAQYIQSSDFSRGHPEHWPFPCAENLQASFSFQTTNLAFFFKARWGLITPNNCWKVTKFPQSTKTYQLKTVQILVALPPPGLSLKEKPLQVENNSYRGIFSMMLLYNC